MTGPVKVKFTCEDKGRHKPKLLGEAMVAADGSVTFLSRGPSAARDGRGRPRRSNTYARTGPETGQDYAVYVLRCPSCPLHVERRREWAEKLARGLAERGETTSDLSRMI